VKATALVVRQRLCFLPIDKYNSVNVAVESFFNIIQAERIWRHSWKTRRKVEMAIFQCINGFHYLRLRHEAP